MRSASHGSSMNTNGRAAGRLANTTSQNTREGGQPVFAADAVWLRTGAWRT